MRENKTRKIDFSRKRIADLAEKYYDEHKYIAALRFSHRELREYGAKLELYARFCDIYEEMDLHSTAINYWFKFLDIAEEEDLPDVYESLATNFLTIGNERAAAYYYNKLVDADESLPEEVKMDIADAFASDKREKIHFVYPPQLADYSRELSLGSKLLKAGDCKRAIAELDKVVKGSKEYVSAKEMQAVAYLLDGDAESAERACEDALSYEPNAVRVLATLAAVYLEQGRAEESLEVAKRLTKLPVTEDEDLFKVATVCCENGLHAEAYKRFVALDERLPYDGRTIYFKGVSAYNSGNIEGAKAALSDLCDIYPDAEVAKYYLREIKEYEERIENGEQADPPKLIYFYHLPQEERENRCRTLLKISGCPKDEAQIFGLLALHDGYFAWCFDEMDGGDRDLQYLGIVTAAHVRADEFLQDVLLDFEVADVLKVEILRMLIERNEDLDVGLTLCNIYRRVPTYKISIGRKRRKKFIEGYAKIASKFGVIDDKYSICIKTAAESLYRSLEKANALDLVDSSDDIACAIYFLAGLGELGKDHAWIASAFDAKIEKVHVLLSYTEYVWKEKTKEERKDEAD